MVKQIVGPLELRGMKLTEGGNTLGFKEPFTDIEQRNIHCTISLCRIGMDVGTSRSGTNKDQGRSSTQGEGRFFLKPQEWE